MEGVKLGYHSLIDCTDGTAALRVKESRGIEVAWRASFEHGGLEVAGVHFLVREPGGVRLGLLRGEMSSRNTNGGGDGGKARK